jgi:hypothetical protein
MRLVPPAGTGLEEDRGWVTLVPDAAGRDSTRHRIRRLEGGAWRFAGFAPGRWTAVVEVGAHPPRVLGPVELPPGRTSLGDVALERGSTLTVRLGSKEGAPVPDVAARLEHAGEPSYERDGDQDGATLTFRGLGAGTFHARFHWTAPDGREREAQRDVTADGRTDLSVDLDVR